jgi:hypothetical protein
MGNYFCWSIKIVIFYRVTFFLHILLLFFCKNKLKEVYLFCIIGKFDKEFLSPKEMQDGV